MDPPHQIGSNGAAQDRDCGKQQVEAPDQSSSVTERATKLQRQQNSSAATASAVLAPNEQKRKIAKKTSYPSWLSATLRQLVIEAPRKFVTLNQQCRLLPHAVSLEIIDFLEYSMLGHCQQHTALQPRNFVGRFSNNTTDRHFVVFRRSAIVDLDNFQPQNLKQRMHWYIMALRQMRYVSLVSSSGSPSQHRVFFDFCQRHGLLRQVKSCFLEFYSQIIDIIPVSLSTKATTLHLTLHDLTSDKPLPEVLQRFPGLKRIILRGISTIEPNDIPKHVLEKLQTLDIMVEEGVSAKTLRSICSSTKSVSRMEICVTSDNYRDSIPLQLNSLKVQVLSSVKKLTGIPSQCTALVVESEDGSSASLAGIEKLPRLRQLTLESVGEFVNKSWDSVGLCSKLTEINLLSIALDPLVLRDKLAPTIYLLIMTGQLKSLSLEMSCDQGDDSILLYLAEMGIFRRATNCKLEHVSLRGVWLETLDLIEVLLDCCRDTLQSITISAFEDCMARKAKELSNYLVKEGILLNFTLLNQQCIEL